MKITKFTFAACFEDLKHSLSDKDFSGYPKDYQRIDQKTEPVIDQLALFRGSHVLEIGSNFGLYSLLMSDIADTIYALEVDKTIFSVGLRWRQFFVARGAILHNLKQIRGAASEAVDISYNALLLTLVLYHLNNDEIDLLLEDGKKKCERVIIQCRPGRRLKKEQGKLSGHVTNTERFDGLYDIAGNIRFLEAMGMRRISVTVSEKLLGGEVFPVITGVR
jgi:hypothetical protein